MNGHSKVAAYLLRLGVDPKAADTSGNTSVHYAAAYGWLHCLKLLIKAGANPNAVNQWKVWWMMINGDDKDDDNDDDDFDGDDDCDK